MKCTFDSVGNVVITKTIDEWLKETLGICYDKMEGCDDPEWSLFSTIADAIVEYRKGKGCFSICHPYDHEGCPLWSSREGEEVHDG